jgi:hypothetical protein
MMTEPFGQRQLDGAAMRAAPRTPQPLPDGRYWMVRTEGVDQPIDIKLDGVGAGVADGRESVACWISMNRAFR